MSVNVFLDTNILVYAHTDFDIDKQTVAQKLIVDSQSFISTQVLQELANTLSRKFKHHWSDVANVLGDSTTNNPFEKDKIFIDLLCGRRYTSKRWLVGLSISLLV